MPTYTYKCAHCASEIEVLQRVGDPKLQACPKCGRELRKIYLPPTIHFKGSGFYSTDVGKS